VIVIIDRSPGPPWLRRFEHAQGRIVGTFADFPARAP
jgi:hypothetical protein